jgi:hypothetical protein
LQTRLKPATTGANYFIFSKDAPTIGHLISRSQYSLHLSHPCNLVFAIQAYRPTYRQN